ncbi:protein prune homolog 2-like [Ylistrum balloti]|uniref:protein prune homolog 2-like n=1 Tax=Ylistrum balloti TaxID=509963 RepID=UPI002905A0F2|nr:protein prune homolog 2-like [Ylistrum balloti]XP_060083779.1 protein prune homolog 2-like [Ylistrum balloti]
MEEYLKFTKKAQDNLPSYEKVHVVLGNEACDLDSAIAAIVYSYYRHKTKTEDSCLYVPVLNIPRKKYHLRTETTFLLSQQGISADLLTFRDDLDLSHLHSCKCLALTLVDHNVLPATDTALEDAVTMVIDHRPRQRPEDGRVQVVMDTVGSCCTLIAEELLVNNDSVVMDHEVALLLYGTILVDTINQSPAAGKTTPRDTAAIQTLEGWVTNNQGRELYEQLKKAKCDLTGLTTIEILEKDLKIVTGSSYVVAMASVSMELEEFVSRVNFIQDCQHFLRDQGAAILVIMTMYQDTVGEPRRQLALCATDNDFAIQLSSRLKNSLDPDLGLSVFPNSHDGIYCYTQENVKASRKKVLPLVLSFSNTPPEVSISDLSFSEHETKNQTVKNRYSNMVPTLNFVNLDDNLGELNEADVMESPRTPDIMVTSVNECSGNSSATASRPGSGFPSYPVTPPNSYMDSGFMGKEQTLPSFNSSEMLNKIQEKKALLSASSGNPSCSGSAGNSVPYTPQNSVIDGGFDWFAKEQNLPSFNSSDMVQKIQQKRSSMGDNSDFSLGGDLMMAQGGKHNDFVPFTPQNSYMENKFNSYMDQSVDPSLLSSHLEAIKGDRSEVRSHSPEVVTSSQSVSQSNFFSESVTDLCDNLNATDDRKSDIGQNKGERNVVAMEIALAMLRDTDGEEAEYDESHSTFDKDDPSNGNQELHKGQRQGHSRGVINLGKGQSPQGDQDGDGRKGPGDYIQEDLVFKDFVYSLAGQMIANAVDAFPNMSNPHVAKSIMGILQPSMGENSSYPLEMAFNKGLTFPVQLKKTPSTTSITVETDYLSRIDPLHGNLDLATSGNKEVIECTSFRKISDSENVEALQGKSWYSVVENMEAIQGKSLDEKGTSMEGKILSELPRNFEASRGKGVSEIPRNFEALQSATLSNLPKNVEALRKNMYDKADVQNGSGSCESSLLPVKNSPLQSANSAKDLEYQDGSMVSPCSGEVASLSAISSVEEYAGQLIREIIASAIVTVTQSGSSSFKVTDCERIEPGGFSDNKTSEGKDQTECSDEKQELHPLAEDGSTNVNILPLGGATCLLAPVDGASSDSSDSCSTTTEGSYRIMMTPDVENLEGQPVNHGQDLEETRRDRIGPLNDQRVRGLPTKEIEKWNEQGLTESDEMNNQFTQNVLENEDTMSKQTSYQQPESAKHNNESVEELSQSINISGVHGCDSKGDNSSHINKLSQLQGDVCETNGAKSDYYSHGKVKFNNVPNYETDSHNIEVTSSDNLNEKGDNFKHISGKEVQSLVKSEDSHQIESFQDGKAVVKVAVDSPDIQTSKTWRQENRNQGKPAVSMTTNTKDRLRGIEFSEEWQDDDIPGMPPTEEEDDDDSSESSGSRSRHSSDSSRGEEGPVRPSNLNDLQKKKKMAANDNILTEDIGDLDPALLGELEWENDTPIKSPAEPIPQYSAEEERQEARLWRLVEISGREQKIDLTVIEPFKRVLSHGGYYGDGLNAIIVFSGCYLPDRSQKDYNYIMDNLFLYVVSTLERLVAEDYMIVYFHGATPRRQMPSFSWLKKCYQMIDRRLKKNLKGLLLVHPTLWLKTIVIMTRPFISSKFSSKLRFVRSLQELASLVPMEYIYVPDHVHKYDEKLTKHSPQPSTATSDPAPLTPTCP